jgi:hypothetical protein
MPKKVKPDLKAIQTKVDANASLTIDEYCAFEGVSRATVLRGRSSLPFHYVGKQPRISGAAVLAARTAKAGSGQADAASEQSAA